MRGSCERRQKKHRADGDRQRDGDKDDGGDAVYVTPLAFTGSDLRRADTNAEGSKRSGVEDEDPQLAVDAKVAGAEDESEALDAR